MSKARYTLVIQVGVDRVRAILAKPDGGSVTLTDPCILPVTRKEFESNPLGDQLIVDKLLAYSRERHRIIDGVMFVLGGGAVTSSFLETPPLSGKALVQATTLKLAHQLHFPVQDAVVAVKPTGQTEDGQLRIHATAGQRAAIDAMVATAELMKLKLIGICAAPDVVAHAASKQVESNGLIAVFDMSDRMSTLVVLDSGTPCVCTDVPVVAAHLTAALMRPIIRGDQVIQLDEETAFRIRNEVGIPDPSEEIAELNVTGDRILPLLEPVLQKLIKQLTQWLTYASTSRSQPIASLQIIGLGSTIRGFTSAISARMGIEVTSGDWLERLARPNPDAKDAVPGGFGISAAAALRLNDLPDLVPEDIRTEQRASRIRRSIAVCAPIIAVAIAAVSMPFESLGSSVEDSLSKQKAQLATVQVNVSACTESSRAIADVAQLEARFSEFINESPGWLPVLKELSLVLPLEVHATEFLGEWNHDTANLTVRADVVTGPSGKGFDEIVRQTVLLLQRSVLFQRVEIISANQGPSDRDLNAVGTLAIRLDLVCPTGIVGGRQ